MVVFNLDTRRVWPLRRYVVHGVFFSCLQFVRDENTDEKYDQREKRRGSRDAENVLIYARARAFRWSARNKIRRSYNVFFIISYLSSVYLHTWKKPNIFLSALTYVTRWMCTRVATMIVERINAIGTGSTGSLWLCTNFREETRDLWQIIFV